MEISYESHIEASAPQLIEAITALAHQVFDTYKAEDGVWRMTHMPNVSAFTAHADGGMVGFKVGYAHTSSRYYSWLGGVHPDYRRMGIAHTLAKLQHQWLLGTEFRLVETEASQSNHNMCRLNEKCGFTPAGMRFDKDQPRIIYRKHFP